MTTPTPAPTPATPATTEPEREIAFDMLRRALPLAPALVGLAALVWRADGAFSSAYGIAIVLVNLLLSAAALSWAARKSAAVLMGTALGGFLVRMVLVVLAIAAVRDQSWFEAVPLGITVVITHLGLLVWESRHVSASLAFPGLKPDSLHRTGA